MRPLVYYFGDLPGGFSSFPEDHTKTFFEEFLKRSKRELQVVVHREGNLLHYGYVRKFASNHFFGLCLCTDRIIKDISYLFDAFDEIYANMAHQGIILKVTPNGNIEWAINKFITEEVALTEYSKQLVDFLSVDENNTLSLPPVDFSIAIDNCLDVSLDNSQEEINDAIGRYPNVYIAKSKTDIERLTSVDNLIKEKNKVIYQLQGEVALLKNENQRIIRQKKQYRFVAALSVVLIGCGLGLLSLNGSLNSTRSELDQAYQTLGERDDSLESKKTQIAKLKSIANVLQSDLNSEVSRREDIEEEFSSYKEMLAGVQPFVVTSTSFSFSTGYLNFEYYGFQETSMTLYVRAYRDDESYYNSNQMNVHLGHNSFVIYVSSRLDGSKYYSFELLDSNNKILGGARR